MAKVLDSSGRLKTVTTTTVGNLDDIGDVVITGVSGGEVLTYSAGNWINSAPSAGSKIVVSMTAGENLTAGDIVYCSASGTASKADADSTAALAQVIGIAESTVSSSASLNVLVGGVSSNFAGLTAGTPYFLSTTAGGITATPSSSSGVTVVRIGIALTSSTLVFQPQVIGVLS